MFSVRVTQFTRALVLLLALAALAACGGSRQPAVYVEPMVSLAPHTRIGVVRVTAQNAEGALITLATQRLTEQVLRAQQGVEVLELGPVAGPIDAAAARRLGEQHGVRTVLVGHLTVSDLKPRVRLLGGLSATTEVTIGLNTRLLSTQSGATLWSRSASVRETMHAASMANGTVVFDAQDPDEAYGEIVDGLVFDVTSDFRGSWVRR